MPADQTIRPHDTPEAEQNAATVAAPVEALLVPAAVAGPMCGVSKATWWRLHAAAKVPAPIRLGGRTLWRRAELVAFCEAGCPDRKTWETMQRAREGTRR
jgi:predicted DNA-binding transcriptional regulator AlpA